MRQSICSIHIKFQLLSLFFLPYLLTSAVPALGRDMNPDSERIFAAWMKKHGITFKNQSEKAHRHEIFENNRQRIETHNRNDNTYKLALNQFAHLSDEEFKQQKLCGSSFSPKIPHNLPRSPFVFSENTPDEIDWRESGLVTSVKNQGNCGSCWAFSTIGAIEGAYAQIAKLQNFSEQQLVDCDQTDEACNGGLMDNAFEFLTQTGSCLDVDYPYTAIAGSCNQTCTAQTRVKAYTDVPSSNEIALKQAVAIRPVAVAIQANQLAFRFYQSGVMTGRCGTNLDHGVLAVGYGTDDNGQMYWIVKNSWGEEWGQDGYILLARSEDSDSDGQCGIAISPSYPEVEQL